LRKRGSVKPPLPLADTPGEGSKSTGWEDAAAADADADADADAAAADDADADEVRASFASINLTTQGARLGGGGL
jgi:hypothetical protein